MKELEKLNKDEAEFLIKAPALVSVLAASADHDISSDEKADAVAMVHIGTFSSGPLLAPYYKEVEKNFKKYFEACVKKYEPFDDAKREALKLEIDKLSLVIRKLDKEFAKALHKSLAHYAEHVKRSNKNLLLNLVFPLPIPGFTE